MGQNGDGTTWDIILMITVAAKPTTVKAATTAAAQKRKPPVATQYFMTFALPPNDQKLSHAASDLRQPETRSEN